VRIAYAADLPTPDDLIRSLTNGESGSEARTQTQGESAGPTARMDGPRGGPRAALAPSAPPSEEPTARRADVRPNAMQDLAQDPASVTLVRFEDVIALAAERRDLPMKLALERDVRLVRFEPGRIEIALESNASTALAGDLARKLTQWSGRRWMVAVSTEQGQPTVKSQNDARRAEFERGVQADPVVKAVLARFPGAQIVAVREREAPSSPSQGDDLPPDAEPDEDL